MTFGDRLRELRLEKSMTQEELGKIFGKSKNNISQYELNKRQADDDFKKQLADFFNVSIDYLLGRTDIKNTLPNQLTKKDEKDIAKDLDEIMTKLENEQGLMFDGEPADEETLNALRDALEMGMRYAKAVNKKYTPKKYRKKDK